MRSTVRFFVIPAFLLLISCRHGQQRTMFPVKPLVTGENASYTVIGSMRNRDRTVTIKTGPKGVVYSVATNDGRSLYENISSDQLKAEAPALHEFIESGTAGYAGLYEARWFDARIDATK
jgi:hypothetical protein